MEVIFKTKENKALADALNDEGVEARVVRNATIIVLPKNKKTSVWEIPAVARKFQGKVCFNCEESGGNGYATIVCSLSGKKLRPYYIFSSTAHNPDGYQALFCVEKAVVFIDAYEDGFVQIVKAQLKRNDHLVSRENTELWYGPLEKLETSSVYADAAAKAVTKARRSDCKAPVFADVSNPAYAAM